MFAIQKSLVVTANQTVNNILSGEIYEFLSDDADVDVLLTESATGLTCTLTADSTVVMSNTEPNIRTTRPITPDDMVAQFSAYKGTRLQMSVTNSTGGSLTLFYTIRGY